MSSARPIRALGAGADEGEPSLTETKFRSESVLAGNLGIKLQFNRMDRLNLLGGVSHDPEIAENCKWPR
jgi:hypothetical protein